MKILQLSMITILIVASISISAVYAEKSSVMLTPFDVSFSEKDFTRSGPSHQILILKPNETASITIKISNHDTISHEINFSIPYPQNIDFIDSYFFEPPTIIVQPNSEQQVLLHLKTKEKTETHWGTVPLVVQSKSFGMVGKYFYLVIGDKDNITESDLALVDHSLREGLPGAAFPFLDKISEKVAGTMITNNFGIPKYLPQDYKFQGISNFSEDDILIYSPTEVTNTTESIDFVRSGGLIIDYQTNGQNFNLNAWMPAYVAQNEAEEINVNGLDGVAIEQQDRIVEDGPKYKSSAQVILFNKNAQVELNGNMTLDELLKVASSIPISGMSENQTMLASCAEDKDWPSKPCNDVINTGDPNQKPILGDKQDWKSFYDMKGKDWMESKKQEMYFADQNGILKEWYEYGGHSGHLANSDVWYYYNLYGQSPDIMKYYNGTIQKDWLKPIITYYYISPIVFIIIGIAAVVTAFFISKKILVKIRK